jgi:prepilin-type N-terminal cleavage/methylation domain-containing protein
MQKNKRLAFSLIELSIVIIIIGIIVAAITQSSKLVKKFRIQTAQTLTKSSPVNSINDLAIWYETSSVESFISSEASDATAVTVWYDVSTQKPNKSNATSGTGTAQPLYKDNRINGLPTIAFDGSDDAMDFDGGTLLGTNYTVFIVGQRNSSNQNYFIGGTSTSAEGTNLAIGWNSNTAVFMYNGASTPSAASYTTASYSTPIPVILTAWFNQASGKKLWYNGGIIPDATSSSATPITSFAGAKIGKFSSTFSQVEIAEIIIFQRDLTNEERQAIEAYLSQKYKIAIS